MVCIQKVDTYTMINSMCSALLCSLLISVQNPASRVAHMQVEEPVLATDEVS